MHSPTPAFPPARAGYSVPAFESGSRHSLAGSQASTSNGARPGALPLNSDPAARTGQCGKLDGVGRQLVQGGFGKICLSHRSVCITASLMLLTHVKLLHYMQTPAAFSLTLGGPNGGDTAHNQLCPDLDPVTGRRSAAEIPRL